MSDLWKEVTTWLSEATRSAIKETEDLARRGRVKMELLGINTALSDKFAALGGVVYEIIKKPGRGSIKANAKVKKLVAEIARLEAQLRASKQKKETPKASRKSSTRKTTAKKTPSKRATKKASGKKSSEGKTGTKSRSK